MDYLQAKTVSAEQSIPIEDLNVIADRLKQLIGVENDLTFQRAADELNKQPASVLSRLFPSQVQRERNRVTVDSMRKLYQDKQKLFVFYSEVKFEVARHMGNALVASVGTDVQYRLAEFANDRLNKLINTITTYNKIFKERMTTELTDLQNYRDFPELFKPAYDSVNNMILTYFQTVDTLLKGFIDSLKSKVAEVQT